MNDWTLADLPAWIRPNVTEFALSGCWLTAPGNGIRLDKDGYARRGLVLVHRVVYTEMIGPIPADRPVIDHVLKNGCVWRNCVNINGHLEPCTIRENTMRGSSFAAINAAKTRCGACSTPYDDANTYWYHGRRDCRRCIARRVREYKQRQQRLTADLEIAA